MDQNPGVVMKKILLVACGLSIFACVNAASAADLPVKAPVYKAPVMAPWWDGFYVGANVGYSWGNSNTNALFSNSATGVALAGASASSSMNGPLGGFQLGYNWQLGTWVFGLETDIQLTDQDGESAFTCAGVFCNAGLTAVVGAPFTTPVLARMTQKLEWFGTLRGRIGTTVLSPTWLAYVTGGLAYGSVDTSGTISGFTAGGAPTVAGFANESTNVGWTIGVGLEGRIAEHWTGKIEYLYMDLGTFTTNAALPTNFIPIAATFNSHVTDNILRVGVNYKFR
jgi:outer membrane immunogenic protein